jgi:D-alanine transaminase
MIVYLNGRYLPKEEAHISPDDRGFLFGDGIYEVVRAHEGRLFRPDAHWQRLRNSLAATEIVGPTDAEVQSIAETLLNKNELHSGQATVYLQITRGVAPRKHGYPQPPVPATVYGYAAPFTPLHEKWNSGVRVITAPDNRWGRCDIKSISLLPSILANRQAQVAGVHEVILMRDGVITEGSHTNFAAVRNGALITHPANNFILNGITRVVALELCKGLNIPVRESPLPESELRELGEAMLLGTTNDVMPVVQINDWPTGGGRPGPITRRLQKALAELVAKEKTPAAASDVGAASL